MAAGEFDLIARHLATLGAPRTDVALGVGDDAAIVDPPLAHPLRCAATCIALAGRTSAEVSRHIVEGVQHLVGQLRNGGYEPAWTTLALTLPQADDRLVRCIAAAVHEVCLAHKLAVVGGDTTAGAASLTVFVLATHS